MKQAVTEEFRLTDDGGGGGGVEGAVMCSGAEDVAGAAAQCACSRCSRRGEIPRQSTTSLHRLEPASSQPAASRQPRSEPSPKPASFYRQSCSRPRWMGASVADRRTAQHARFTTQSSVTLAAHPGGKLPRSTRAADTPSYPQLLHLDC
jgi:hypothetical protein